MKDTWYGRLPDGTVTRNKKKYVTAWRRISEPVRKALGVDCYIHSFDPGVTFGFFGKNSRTLHLDVDTLRRLTLALANKS